MKSQEILHFDDTIFKKTGLVLEENLTFENWQSLFNGLEGIDRCSKWWIGDCLNIGEKKFGEKYAQVIEGSSFDSIRDMKFVSEKVPIALRNANLSWTHHKAIAGLEPDSQKEYLDIAEREKLSSREFRDLITTDFKEKQTDDENWISVPVSRDIFEALPNYKSIKLFEKDEKGATGRETKAKLIKIKA